MKAIVLLRTNPGFQEKAYKILEGISAKGIKSNMICHCFGRFDGAITCEYDDLKKLNAFTEKLRKDGVFNTETLIVID
ncbi:MAG: hypothetical protein M0Q91_08820 [Methanoregula sp.]|jgi:uncharacterized protein with GYD domain|nr:hypothetical protein [Methanoregula sp.]